MSLARLPQLSPLLVAHTACFHPITGGGAGGAHFARHVHRPLGRAKPGVGGIAGGGTRAPPLVLVLVVLVRRRPPSAQTLMAGIDRPQPPTCCKIPHVSKHMFQVFHMFERYVGVFHTNVTK
jgi:hypothetical protein